MNASAAPDRHHEAGSDTRRALIAAAAREMHAHGFQAASLAGILADTGVTKGALYHHFPSKLDLGYAVFDEYYAPALRVNWIAPLQGDRGDALTTLISVISRVGEGMSEQDVALGCPVNNLAQEMSAVDAGFRARIEGLFDEWRRAIENGLDRLQRQGGLEAGVDTRSLAAFIVASLEGCLGMAKNAQRRDVMLECGKGLIAYLQSLRRREPAGVGDRHA